MIKAMGCQDKNGQSKVLINSVDGFGWGWYQCLDMVS